MAGRRISRALKSTFVIALFSLQSTLAHAFAWDTCNDTPVKWANNSAHYQVMRCSIPEGSQRASDVTYAFDQWNDVVGMWDVFSWEFGTSDCVSISHSNATNEVFYGVASQMDGAVGVTTVRYDTCFWWLDTQHILEADMAFDAAQITEWGNPSCRTLNGPGSRTTTIHEAGHAHGLEHDDSVMNLMMTSDGEGKYCGNFVIEPHPDDAAGGRFLYGSGKPSTDIGASAHRFVGSNNVGRDTPTRVTSLCPGEQYTFQWSVGNMGTVGVGYNVSWVLSSNEIISTNDIFLDANFGAFESAGGFDTWSKTLTVPRTVPFDREFFVGTILDFDGAVGERFETNNNTALAGRILTRPQAECR